MQLLVLRIAALLMISQPASAQTVNGQAGPAQKLRAAAPPSTAAACLPTVPTLKRIAASEWAKSKNADRVLAAVDEAIGADAAMPQEFLSLKDGLLFYLTVPSRLYRFTLSEAVRKREDFSTLVVGPYIRISVSATSIDAPNIEKVIVERDGRTIAPVSGRLTPRVKVTRLGAKAVINEAVLQYPCSAFLPGAQVTVTGIPESGSNMTSHFDEDKLVALTGHPGTPRTTAADLVGLPNYKAAKYLPSETSTRSGEKAGYLHKNGSTLYVTTRNLAVAEVSDGSVALADLIVPTKISNPPTIQAPADAPRASAGRCGDGSFYSKGADCRGLSGIAERYIVPAPGQVTSMTLTRCGIRIHMNDWNGMSSSEQRRLCPEEPASALGVVPTGCRRPDSISVADWNLMSADSQLATCIK